jgi:hypothetical protein
MTELRSALAFVKKLVQPYFVHAAGQAIAWLTVETHHLTAAETAAATTATLVLTSLIKKVSTWLASPAPKA